MNNQMSDALKDMLYPQTKELISLLEKNYHELTTVQKMDLEKLKFSIKMYELEKEI